MSRSAHGRKRQRARALRLPSLVPADRPVAERVRGVDEAAGPVELLEPEFVCDPVALPVVRARIDEHAHSALKQAGDVEVRGRGVLVEVRVEGAAYV